MSILIASLALMSTVLLALVLGVTSGYLLVILILKAFGRAQHRSTPSAGVATPAQSTGD